MRCQHHSKNCTECDEYLVSCNKCEHIDSEGYCNNSDCRFYEELVEDLAVCCALFMSKN